MKFRPLFLLLAAVLGLALSAVLQGAEERGLPPRGEALHADILLARSLVERSLEWRVRARTFIQGAKPRLDGGVLTSADLGALYRGGEDYVFLSRRWQALVDVQGVEAWHRATPSLVHNPLARTQTKLVLAAALVQHDDYALGVDPYFKERKLRKLLKSDHPAVVGELDGAVERFLDPVRRLRMARAVIWYKAEGYNAPDRSEDEKFLDEIIIQSPGYQYFSRQLPTRLVDSWLTGGHAGVAFVMDLLSRTGSTMMNTASLVVGNTMGLVQTRNGYLKDLSESDKAGLRSRLRPLDVLLEKTPFRLTDKSIPGHYGHVAVWVGGEADLRELGVWDDPLVRPHHDRIRAGAGIVEALRPGVELNTLEQFLNIDDLLVIRHGSISREETRSGVLRAFAQIGKGYDFNFDVESDRKIVCSELAFVVFPDVNWPTTMVLGRHSISPDQVAVRARTDGPFWPVILFHDGVEVSEKLPEVLDCFLRTDYKAFSRLLPGFKGRSQGR